MLEKITSKYSFQNLLTWLLLYLLIAPALREVMPLTRVIISIVMSIMLFFAAYTISLKRGRLFRITIILMAVTQLLYWAAFWSPINLSQKISTSCLIIYLGLLIFMFSQHIMRAKRVDSSLISATLCLYLFLGLLWALVFALLENIAPGSFQGDLVKMGAPPLTQLDIFQYLSFVTITTLGYGDILPNTRFATALCSMEAVIGQFFMAVLVARLVGIQVSQQFSSDETGDEADNQ